MVIEESMTDSSKTYWIFGYGSLIWKANFPYIEKRCGFIKNYARRFWQGSHDHRGTPELPGRVVTLEKQTGELTWGVAYHVHKDDWELVINNLNTREIDGYTSEIVEFYLKNDEKSTIPVLLYIALPENGSFLGDAPIDAIANQIFCSKGPSGTNVEYLLNLANSLKEMDSRALDRHTAELEEYIINLQNTKVKCSPFHN